MGSLITKGGRYIKWGHFYKGWLFYIRGLVLQGVALESLICKNRFFLKPGAHAHNFLKFFFIIFLLFFSLFSTPTMCPLTETFGIFTIYTLFIFFAPFFI